MEERIKDVAGKVDWGQILTLKNLVYFSDDEKSSKLLRRAIEVRNMI